MKQPPVDGFLSPILDQWSDEARQSAPDWSLLIQDINRAAVALLPTLAPRRNSDRELVAAALYARALQTFEASILLANRGMLADAGTLARSILETTIYLGGLAQIENFVARMAAANNQHYFKFGRALVDFATETNIADVEELKGHLADEALKEHKASGIIMQQLAKEVGMGALYEVVYRQLSGDAAHPSVASSERHIVRGADRGIEKLIFQPQREGMEKMLSCAIIALLGAWQAVGVIFNRSDIPPAIELYNMRHQALSAAFSDRSENNQ
ncbi:DUF5677 domain-containing protein [Rugamonas aquatica]|uniref:Uncharacterized protein n=1 Tax=Rugamonas aquatica TaxID=2743357 RepID=A0A6A7N0S1_9BURK|nr:DUF5677 domain-containing protein [Rugamonas aquatica]MQA38633.1 hypothetical protein [Rugamonas aquatica]